LGFVNVPRTLNIYLQLFPMRSGPRCTMLSGDAHSWMTQENYTHSIGTEAMGGAVWNVSQNENALQTPLPIFPPIFSVLIPRSKGVDRMAPAP
jgi:hypothetical protein